MCCPVYSCFISLCSYFGKPVYTWDDLGLYINLNVTVSVNERTQELIFRVEQVKLQSDV